MQYNSLSELIEKCHSSRLPLWQVICADSAHEDSLSFDDEFVKMGKMWETMLSCTENYDASLMSSSRLSGGDGGRMESFMAKETTVCGSFIDSVITTALKMGESNACMKRIVAAPTAGSCGVLPSVLVSSYKAGIGSAQTITQSLFVSAAIGGVIAQRASIAGAQGGCQAEIGAASAMAAGALVHIHSGSTEQIMYAASMALQNLLGLTCDPVAGLVEIPCVKRNVIGAVNACSCADMALAGITTKIPPDQVIDAMKSIGDKMDISLKETGLGGLAATDEGLRLAKLPSM